MPKKTPKVETTPQTDQDRIRELEKRVDLLEDRIVAQLEELNRYLGSPDGYAELQLGNVLSLEVPQYKGSKEEALDILGDLGLPPVEERAGRAKRRS
jgi:hypothetical protein